MRTETVREFVSKYVGWVREEVDVTYYLDDNGRKWESEEAAQESNYKINEETMIEAFIEKMDLRKMGRPYGYTVRGTGRQPVFAEKEPLLTWAYRNMETLMEAYWGLEKPAVDPNIRDQ